MKPDSRIDHFKRTVQFFIQNETNLSSWKYTRSLGKNESPTFDTTWTAQKTMPPPILRCRGNVLLPSNDKGKHKPTDSPLIRYGPHRKWWTQQFFVAYIRCRGNVYTKPLPSNNRGVHMQTHRLMGGVYKVRRCDGLRCHDIHTKFHKTISGIQKFMGGGDSQTHSMEIV
jgi:hypothetical protein